MARGSIVWRCGKCRKNATDGVGKCSHQSAAYYIIFRSGRLQKWERIGPKKKDAEARLSEILSSVNKGTFFAPPKILFSEFSKKWLDSYARVSIKDSTFRNYESMINSTIVPALGDRAILGIRPHDIQKFISELNDKRSAKTVNHHLSLLKTMFNHARKWKYIFENPAADIDRIREEQREMDFLTPQDIRLLLKNSDEPLRTIILTAVLTGMRRGELLGLQWKDIDWNRKIIFVRRSLYWRCWREIKETNCNRWKFITPKSRRSIRTIVMSKVLEKGLNLYRELFPPKLHDLIFCNVNGDPLDPDNLVKRDFSSALKKAGLRRVRFHDLRHTYTTLLISQGENIKLIQSQLGHASIQTTLDRYGHLLPVVYEGVGKRLDEEVFGSRANMVLTKPAQIRNNCKN